MYNYKQEKNQGKQNKQKTFEINRNKTHYNDKLESNAFWMFPRLRLLLVLAYIEVDAGTIELLTG